jgi:hypothetical protein
VVAKTKTDVVCSPLAGNGPRRLTLRSAPGAAGLPLIEFSDNTESRLIPAFLEASGVSP